MPIASAGRITVQTETRDGGLVATVVIDRPDRLNAMGAALFDSFAEAVRRLSADPALRAIVVAGAGERAFVGGADIGEMSGISAPETARAFILKVHEACASLRACPAPVIARIQGYCFGAGLELAAACDFRIAGSDAQFGMPEVRLGIPSVVEAALLPRLIGWGRARRLLLTGETIGAGTALGWALVEEAAAPGELDASVERALADILACGPEAVRSQKRLIAAWERLPLEAAIEAGVEAFAQSFMTDEPQRMMAAFLAARAARKA